MGLTLQPLNDYKQWAFCYKKKKKNQAEYLKNNFPFQYENPKPQH